MKVPKELTLRDCHVKLAAFAQKSLELYDWLLINPPGKDNSDEWSDKFVEKIHGLEHMEAYLAAICKENKELVKKIQKAMENKAKNFKNGEI